MFELNQTHKSASPQSLFWLQLYRWLVSPTIFPLAFIPIASHFLCNIDISLFPGNKVAGKCKLLLALFINLCKVCLAVTGPDKFWLPTSQRVKPWHHVLPHLHGVWVSPKHLTRRFIFHYIRMKINNASLHWKSCQQAFSDLLGSSFHLFTSRGFPQTVAMWSLVQTSHLIFFCSFQISACLWQLYNYRQ